MFGIKAKNTSPDPVIIEDAEPVGNLPDEAIDELSQLKEALKKSEEEKSLFRQKAEESERQRGETSKKLATTEDARFTAEERSIDNAITAAKAEADRLEREYVELQENGKFAEAAKVSRQLASAQGNIDKWSDRKNQYVTYRENQKNTPAPAEDKLAGFTPRTKEWIAKNPWFLTDSIRKNKAMAAHYEATAEGIPLDSDEYFEYIESKVNKKDDAPVKHKSSVVSSTSLPPSRGNGMSGTKNGNGDIRLSAAEAEIAVLSNPRIPAAEAQKLYYEEKQKLIREDRIKINGAMQ